jgi:hypothetical protein
MIMKYDTGTIITGVALLLVFSYLAIALVSFLFIYFMDKKKENKLVKVFALSGLMSISWLLTTALCIWITSAFSPVFFILLASLLLFGASYFLASKLFVLARRDLIIYAGISAVVFNPGWLVLIGIL